MSWRPAGFCPLTTAPHPLLQLEAELQRLSSAHREAGSEKLQLREAQRDLAGRLEQVQEQLQMTQGHLNFARSRVSWQVEEEPRQVAAARAGVGTRGFLEERGAVLRLSAQHTRPLIDPTTLSGPFPRQGN